MSSTPKFAHCDTRKADGCYVQFERVIIDDNDSEPDYLFQDPDYKDADLERLDAFHAGKWHFIGVRARALCLIVRNGVGTYINLESPGLCGTESDSHEDYLNGLFEDEKAELKSMLSALSNPTFEN